MTDTILSIKNISKSFGGVKALNDISLDIYSNTVHGLIGPNGAGKTTLFNVVTGLYQADFGQICLAGQALTLKSSPQVFARLGVARTFQNIRLFSDMTAVENIMVGQHIHCKSGLVGAILHLPSTQKEEADMRAEALRLLSYVGLSGDLATRTARTLSYGDQRRLEIARALALKPKLLALDEPAAGMNPTETEALCQLILKLKSDGLTILLIEHDVRLMMTLCDRISVLNFGEKIAEGNAEHIRNHPAVIEAYLGSEDA